jgi:CRISPR-associated endonuclease/helicase Cas3
MTYYSHSKLDESGVTFGSKKLHVHINGVKENALFHFAENLSLGYSSEELKELIKIVIDFHDLGKYTSYFQNYLLKKEPIDFLLKRHAQLGGFIAYNYLEKEEKKALLALYLIFLHHSPLLDVLEISCKLGDDLERIITKQKEDIEKALPTIAEVVGIKNLNEFLFYSEEKKLRKGFKYWGKKYASIQDYFLINYLFSLLIEGDKLDASDTVPYSLQPIKPTAVDDRFGKPTTQNKSLEELDNNELRNYCRAVVVSNLEQKDILEHYIFTLTAPTGIGKTMTALDFSLKLKDKIKQESGIESRIIYALPFINIIEQSLNEYQKVLDGQNVNILGHYQYADVFGKNGEQKKDVDGAEHGYDQKLMALDTWQADIVITSFVQFFETLISNRNKLLKKFNHFANAIIILDEVQTLRLDQMPLLGAALFYLSKFIKSRIILMTATRPKIFELAEQEILKAQNEKIVTKELLTNYEEVFSLFERTAIYPLLNDLTEEKGNRTQEFVSSIFDEKWNTKKSCLIVCNTVNRSVEVFEVIKSYLVENNLKNPIYYLSTNIIPAHRLQRIQAIKDDIQQNKAPILIATQVVEAGVDLDFNMGFRDIGPIDSIIQVAGRINRNNNPKKTNAPLYIIDFDPKATTMVYGRLTYVQAKKSLKMEDCFFEKEYLKLITEYFDGISEKSSFADARAFFNSMQTLKYDADDKKTLPVSAFRIIEESDRYAAVFIEIDGCATEILEKYLQKITNKISKEEFNKKWKLKFQQHIISVPKYLCEDLKTVNEYEDSILRVSKEEIISRYNTETGYNRNYKEENTTYVF